MYYDLIMKKIADSKFEVTEIKDIPHGKCIKVDNGAIINCYDSGKHVIQHFCDCARCCGYGVQTN